MSEENNFGEGTMELLMDAKCDNPLILQNERLLSLWMLRLCGIIGMTPVDEPIVKQFPLPVRSKVTGWGLSACLFLAESNIMVHTYPEYDYMFLNVFSCKAFDIERAVVFIVKTLRVVTKTSYLFKRGVDMWSGTPELFTPVFP